MLGTEFLCHRPPTEQDVWVFQGNSSESEEFRLVLPARDSLIIGSKNVIYNVSLRDLTVLQEECQNYIRVMVPLDSGSYFVCGTHAFSPLCREYRSEEKGLVKAEEENGKILCPHDPKLNSTALYHEGHLFSASYADFQGADPLIYRKPLRTRQYDLEHFSDPDFVSSTAEGDFVFFFFRELAVEYSNCGKAVYSRVGRVCKNDPGGSVGGASKRWSSFLKARLNCSIPGLFPFYFDELQGATEFVEGKYGGREARLMYGTFTTPQNSIGGSAVCAFSLRDILNVFEGRFKHNEGNAKWTAVKGPEARPGRCVNMSRGVDATWIEAHPIMDEAVPATFGSPILLRTVPTAQYRFTKIAVDPQVETVNSEAFDVLFIGTDGGWVIKVLNGNSWTSWDSVDQAVIEELHVFPTGEPIRNIQILNDEKGNFGRKFLLVLSDSQVKRLPLARCSKAHLSSCSECVSVRDPYCAWDESRRACVELDPSIPSNPDRFIQAVGTGVSPRCPQGEVMSSTALHASKSRAIPGQGQQETRLHGTIFTAGAESSSSRDGEGERGRKAPTELGVEIIDQRGLYTVETLAVTVTGATLGALLIGFFVGWMVGRRCRKEHYDAGPCVDAEYEFLEQRGPNLHRFGGESTMHPPSMHPPPPPPVPSAPPDQGCYTHSPHLGPGSYMTGSRHPHSHYASKPMNLMMDVSPKNGAPTGLYHATAEHRPFLMATSSPGPGPTFPHTGTLGNSSMRKMYL
ncbi:unnamed protein product [Darwinula stevensoni]|uniref:Semaphorin-1A n=1 Tax=Darwinula stevensoni TaxID=69355 RepID=A0A7R9A7B1_9CRUS|nr:unnamed protein product [Darwinula stevensoni]CAG0891009.1 unnamed protein product [Darwinula stevensoni]